jgi:hypothetical protein
MTMWTDPVVDEIHRIREKMLAAVGGDTAKLMARIREHQSNSGRAIVGEVRRRAAAAKAGESTGGVGR